MSRAQLYAHRQTIMRRAGRPLDNSGDFCAHQRRAFAFRRNEYCLPSSHSCPNRCATSSAPRLQFLIDRMRLEIAASPTKQSPEASPNRPYFAVFPDRSASAAPPVHLISNRLAPRLEFAVTHSKQTAAHFLIGLFLPLFSRRSEAPSPVAARCGGRALRASHRPDLSAAFRSSPASPYALACDDPSPSRSHRARCPFASASLDTFARKDQHAPRY
jgi:hypothetical protein